MAPYVVAALYRFAPLGAEVLAALVPTTAALCDRLGIKGTLLLAQEGINGTVAGSRPAIDELLARLRAVPGLEALEHKESRAKDMPFHRMKVRLKREIVTLGQDVDPTEVVGNYVEPEAWAKLLDDPEVVVIDTRNDYEVGIGTFRGATNPRLQTFREFPQWVAENLDPKQHRKVAMFCTGGIRCEKASSFLLAQGFAEVHHLKGGILTYLERIPEETSAWEGECFVFDQRVAVTHGLAEGTHTLCFGCREPLSREDLAAPEFEDGVACKHCHAGLDDDTRARRRERYRQIQLAKARGERHIGRSFDRA